MTTIFLVAQEREERGELIIGSLLNARAPLGDTASVRHPLPPAEARADVAAWLDSVDADWRRFVSLL